jgi:hypothetical protein
VAAAPLSKLNATMPATGATAKAFNTIGPPLHLGLVSMRWLLKEYQLRIFESGGSVRGLIPNRNRGGTLSFLALIHANVGDISAHVAKVTFATVSIRQFIR